MARRIAFAIPGDFATLTGGYGYDRRIIAELRQLGWDVDLLELGDGFPMPSAKQRATACARLLNACGDHPMVIDGLALGALPEAAAALRSIRPVVALVHHPLASEVGLTREMAQHLYESEHASLASADEIIVTSRFTGSLLATRFDIPAMRITVVVPGTDRVPCSAGSGSAEPLSLLSVGAIGPRKGFDLLVEALARVPDLSWRLTIAGDRDRDRAAVAHLDATIERHGLASRIASIGAVSPQRLAALYDEADLFVLASVFEGYGMAYAEAMAHGLPIIGTTGGAIPEVVPVTAGRLVLPGSIDALALALRDVVGDGVLRRELARGARVAALRLPSWAQSGASFSRVLERIA